MSKVLRKLYYSKAVTSRKATCDSTHLFGVLLFGSRNTFQKLSQKQSEAHMASNVEGLNGSFLLDFN